MGFYNIFKIIRLCLKDIFGYKLFRKLLIIILTIILSLFIYTKVNADSSIILNSNSYGEIPIKSDYNNYYWVITIYNQSAYVFVSDTPFTVFNRLGNIACSENVNFFDASSSPVGSNAQAFSNYFNSLQFNLRTDTLRTVIPSTYLNGQKFSNFDVKYTNGSSFINATNLPITYPTLSNTQTQLENLNFNNFIINANSYTEELENNDGTLFMLFYNRSLTNSQTTDGLYPIKEKAFTKGSIYTDYQNSTSDNMVFSYPIFNSGVYFNIGSIYEIRFAKQVYNSEYNTMVYEYLGEPIQFTVSSNVTQDYINQLNQQTATSTDNEATQDLQNSINNQTNAINNQTQSIDNINNSITNSTVDNSSINLPTDNTNDPTQSGVDNIFQTIYNSFTSGTPQDIVFPIPNTDKNITLSANYTYNSLQNNNASWVITITQAFWWYLISRFIITDIMQKVRKIKQGNLENIENSNIKEDML